MRFPLLPILIILIFNLLIDFYLWRRLKKSSYNILWRKLHVVLASICNIALVVVICVPKRSGDNADLSSIMWTIYAWFSIYIPKLLFVFFDLLASVPLIFHRKRLKILDLAGIVIAAAVFIIMWWGALINRYNIDVNCVDVEIEGLPAAFDGYTIAQISDLHVGTYGYDTTYVAEVADVVNSLSPNMIAFTGDIVNRISSELEPFVGTLSQLKAPDGVYSILGNHDYGDYYNWPSDAQKQANLEHLCNLQKQMGWKMLNNAYDIVRRSNDSIAIIGVENVGDPPFHTYGDLDAAYPALDDPTTKILLSHNPAHWDNDIQDAPDKNIALTLSGHTHAMQMCVFGWSPAAFRYPTWSGLYKDNDKHRLYVNIGIGEVAIPSRIGATPEITLITLRAK
ncbi:MAG: metallophosphoesterase [Muribaculaceae bacterium]|nr:metallophosphoesterase [Muribaculaceae bacterium]